MTAQALPCKIKMIAYGKKQEYYEGFTSDPYRKNTI